MARVNIPGVGYVSFPDKMSDEQILAQARAIQERAQQPLLDPRELPTTEIIKGGFARGLEGLKGTVFDLVPALGASLFGNEKYAKEQLKEYQDRMAAIEAEYPTAYKSYKNIKGIGGAFDFAAETFGELGPDIASFMIGTGVGTTVGKKVATKGLEKIAAEQAAKVAAKKGLSKEAEQAYAERLLTRAKDGMIGKEAAEQGAKVGLDTGLWGTSLGTNVPDVFNSIYQDTGTLNPGIALTIGPLIAALDTYLPGKMLKQLGPSGKARVAAEMLQKSDVVPINWKKAFGAEVLKTAGGESLTEGGQQVLQILGSQIAGDKDPFFSQKNVDDIINASLKGFVGGGTYGMPGGALEASRIKSEREAQIAQRAAQQTQAPPPPPPPPAAPPPTPEQVAAQRREERQLAARQQMYGDLFGQPVPQRTTSMPTFPVGQEIVQPEAVLAPAKGELNLGGAPVQGELDLQPREEVKPPAEFTTVLDSPALLSTGLKPQSGFFKKLLNKDMANPADQAAVRDVLVQVRTNPNLSESTKKAIEAVAMQAFGALAKQQEMFGPRGAVLKGADVGKTISRPVVKPTGTSVPTAVEPTSVDQTAARAEPSEQDGMGSAVRSAVEPAIREEVQQDTLAEAPAEEDALTRANKVAALTDKEIFSDMAGAKALINSVIDELGIEIPGHTKNRNDKNALVTKRHYIQEHLQGTPTPEEQDALQAELDAELGQTKSVAEPTAKEDADKINKLKRIRNKAEKRLRQDENLESGDPRIQAAKDAYDAADAAYTKLLKEAGARSDARLDAMDAEVKAKAEKSTAKTTRAKKGKAQRAPKVTETVDVDKLLEEADEIPIEIPKAAKFDVSGGYTNFAKKDIESIDDGIAITDLLRSPTLTPIAKAAKTYFSKMPRVVDNLLNMAFDIVYKTPQFKHTTESSEEAEFFKGMNFKNAEQAFKWVQNNLSPETNKTLREFIRRFEIARDTTNDEQFMDLIRDGISGTRENYDDETVKSYLQAMEDDKKTRKLLGDAVSRLSHGLHPIIITALQAGDLQTALRLLAASSDQFVARTAGVLANVTPDTKVVIQRNLVDENGRPVPGYFDPQTNTIYLDSVNGMNSHVLLHESGHSAMSHELDNPNSVLARQLQQILDKVRDSLGTAYGATDVHEFAAEAWANKEFRGKLQSIYPDGSNISAWDKFSRAVVNFFRRLVGKEARPLTSAYDEVDRILNAIVSPAPDSRNAGVLYAQAANKSAQVFSFTDKMINAVPLLSESQKDALSGGIAMGSEATKSALFSVLPMHALGEVANKVFPGLGTKFNTLINQRAGYENQLNRGIDTVVALAKNAIKVRPEQREAFNRVVMDSTFSEVDPTKPMSEYKEKEDIEEWKSLNAQYKKLNPVWQSLYTTMRNAYKKMYDEVKEAINARIDETALDNKTKILVKRDIMKKLAEQGMIEPYFALGREGKYWLASDYTDKSGQKQFTVEAFKSPRERSRRQAELKALDPNARVDVYSNISQVNYRNAPSGSFVNSVLRIMETNGVPEQAIDETMRLFLTTLPETAFAKSFQKRKGTPGAMTDAIGVFERKMRSTSHQVSNMRYNPQLTAVVDSMAMKSEELGKGGKDNQTEVRYVNEFRKHLEYVRNPTKNDIGSILTSGAFFYTLGFNISSAIVNLANVPMIVAPYLNGKYADGDVAKAIGNASKVFLNSGRKAAMPVLGADGTTAMMDVMPSMANYAPDSVEGKKYATLIRIADEQGQLNRSQLYEIINGDTRTGALAKINAMSGWAFHHGERMNREVTMLAAYDLELDKLKKQGITGEAAEVQAANNAIYTAELTNGGISAAAAPRIAQSSLGKVLFMYKRYGVSMYYMLFKTAKDALSKSDLSPAERKAAWKQLGGVFGMSALMAGVQGIPLFGLASMVYSLFCDEDDDDLDTVTRKYMGEFMYKGPIEYMTNLSIAGRMSLSDLIIRDTKGGSSAGSFSQQVLTAIGGPVLGVGDRIQRGYSKIAEGHVERGLEDILPSSLANVLKATRYAVQGTQTLRGDPITGDVSAWNVGAQAFGFAPADYTNQIEENSRLKGIEKYVNQTGTKLRQKWNLARTVGDTEGMQDARDELLKLGAKHPGLGLNAGTINGILEDSKKQYDRATKEMVHGVRYSKKMREELKLRSAEYDQ